jgi:hypothetical protein
MTHVVDMHFPHTNFTLCNDGGTIAKYTNLYICTDCAFNQHYLTTHTTQDFATRTQWHMAHKLALT